MTDSASTDASPPKRPRGRPARLTRDQILDVARAFDPRTLTMQALADELGVDRKSLNYHVKSRDDLMELLAADAFATALTRLELAADADWRDILREYVTAMRDCLMAVGPLAEHLSLTDPTGLRVLEANETCVRALLQAGFSDLDVARTVSFIAQFIGASADAELARRIAGGRAFSTTMEHELAGDADRFTGLRRIAVAHADADDDLDFDLDVLIAGLERRLAPPSA
jgi:AcrR family transcriptional regulator